MITATDGLLPNEEIVPYWASAPGSGYASIVTQPLGNAALRFGVQQLCGCTMLLVVSRHRGYLGECSQFIANLREHEWRSVRTKKAEIHLLLWESITLHALLIQDSHRFVLSLVIQRSFTFSQAAILGHYWEDEQFLVASG